jgi:hypothetical protein
VQFFNGRHDETATSIREAKRLAGGFASEIDDLEGRRWLVYRTRGELHDGSAETARIMRLTPEQRRELERW